MLKGKKFEPYIRHIRFPFYRNLRENLEIEFQHPITALVGPNGTNKTAILRALQGCPDYHNVGTYWFSTSLDPIVGMERHRFIHGYLSPTTEQTIESLKTRITRKATSASTGSNVAGNPDYFEPSRPVERDGMTKMPELADGEVPTDERTRTRWKAVPKDVIYLDFRSELSAYDKYFFHSPVTKSRERGILSYKKTVIRRSSPHLKESISSRRTSHFFNSRDRIVTRASSATEAERDAISEILGRAYDEITFIGHRYYNNVEGTTVLLTSYDHQYSEAFAGSGEFAVSAMVRKIFAAKPRSLILLDEPEVSLHPKAQRALMEFLAKQAEQHFHQIVISTHSPEIIAQLPSNAIKLLQQSEVDGKVDLLSQATEPHEAFFRLGVELPKSKTIFVEDLLAEAIVRHAIRELGAPSNAMLSISPLPGGAGAIQTKYIPVFALTSDRNILVYLDGDQKKLTKKLAPNEIADADLEPTAIKLLNAPPQLYVNGSDGTSSKGQKESQWRKIIEWSINHLDWLPGLTPEGLLLQMINEDPEELTPKEYWVRRTEEALGVQPWEKQVTAADILSEQKRALAKVDSDRAELVEIRERVQSFLLDVAE